MKIFKPSLFALSLLFCTFSLIADDHGSGRGTVAEIIEAESYIYVRLAEGDTWIATTKQPVAVGDEVEYSGAMLMQDFTSKSLGRSFESIFFTGKLQVANSNSDSHHAPTVTDHQPQASARGVTAQTPQIGEITPLEDGSTIAGILAESESLKGQNVAVRARVMKISKNIMGKHWVTLQDGTGEAPNDRLIATTQAEVAVGELVTVKGVIHTDIDLGSGYHYAVLLEQAEFSH